MGWSEVHDGAASELKEHLGLWALKGDRLTGLDVRIVRKSYDQFAVLRIVRGEFQGKTVWDVFLDNKKADSMFRRIIEYI